MMMSGRNVREGLLSRVQAAFVGAVSGYDAWLVVRYSGVIREIEENPVGVAMIRLANGAVAPFVIVKLLGSALAVGILFRLISRHHHLARPVLNAITAFQIWLLWYLTMTSPGDAAIPIGKKLLVLAMLCACVAPFLYLRPPRRVTPVMEPRNVCAAPVRVFLRDWLPVEYLERFRRRSASVVQVAMDSVFLSRGSIIRSVSSQARNDTPVTIQNGSA